MSELYAVSQFLSTNKAGQFAEPWQNPDPRLLDVLPRQFAEQHGRIHDPAPPVPACLPPSKEFQICANEFLKGMREFLNSAQDKGATQAFDSRSWDNLKNEATEAYNKLDEHEKRRKNWRNPFEAADKLGGAVARRIEFLIELLPDGDYSGLLAGGLRLLCKTAQRKKEVRETILNMLDSISDTVAFRTDEIRMYRQDLELRDRSEKLYMAILNFIRYAVAYLDRSSALESFKAFFKQDEYQSDLDSAVEEVNNAAKSFEGLVFICLQKRVQQIDHNIQTFQAQTNRNFRTMETLYFYLAGMAKDISQDIKSLLEEQKREAQAPTVVQTLHFVNVQGGAPPPQASVQMAGPQFPSLSIPSTQLCQLLFTKWRVETGPSARDLMPDLVADVQSALGIVPTHFGENQLGLLMRDSAFSTWLRALNSQFVILHDDSALESNNSLSTSSHLCALLSKSMSVPGMLPLTFFCGLHTADGDSLEGGDGIMRGLALQLLQAFGDTSLFSLPIPGDAQQTMQRLTMNDLTTTCSIFSTILQHISSPCVVLVMIDGACWYDTELRGDGMQIAMRFLCQAVEEARVRNGGLVLKVLVTNPTRRQRNLWGIPATDVDLEQSLLTGVHGGEASRVLSL
ncbi:uncharacterized protein C8A04DRAFT_38728 [Dichotomopilus funicola]|uniref:DUF7708 domain-containing protein n=1 Tax=Dichotomopilus funicola TaxID=1934379 RepID=A0AAN6V043_9PEZI|nr:hypothetical protein C8A04DRAFT_38728 [Dichotomopilus funicola]